MMKETSRLSAYFASRRKLRDQVRQRGLRINELETLVSTLKLERAHQRANFYVLLSSYHKARRQLKNMADHVKSLPQQTPEEIVAEWAKSQ